jgi:hypothetical protein
MAGQLRSLTGIFRSLLHEQITSSRGNGTVALPFHQSSFYSISGFTFLLYRPQTDRALSTVSVPIVEQEVADKNLLYEKMPTCAARCLVIVRTKHLLSNIFNIHASPL